MAKLKIKDGHGKERIHELVDAITTLGRASSNTLQVSDDKASRAHFRIEKVDKNFKVIDLGSTNGTRLNGSRLKGESILKHNDVILLGKTTFTYDDPDAIPIATDEIKPAAKIKEVPSDPLPAASGNATVELDAVRADEVPSAAAEQTEDATPKYVLKVLEGASPGKVYELGAKVLTMGRHNSSTIQIIDDATSNYHAEINREPIGYVLTDLGSTNGTRVRHKNKKEFEKIVKTPLAPGMQIRVGKTLLDFENIGKQIDDDAVFGTVSLDPVQLDAASTNRPASFGSKSSSLTPSQKKLAMSALMLLLFIGVVVGVVKTFGPKKPSTGTPNVPENTYVNLIQNGDFEDGTDDEGYPRHFRVDKGASGSRVVVVPEANHATDSDSPQKLGLQISKGGGAKASAPLTKVVTADAFPVNSGKTYEFSSWMRNEGDGLYGLHVTWIAGDRQVIDYPLVLKDQQEWKPRSIPLSPPTWAQMARVGVFAQGKEGKASFDSLLFREANENARPPVPSVKFSGISINFEGAKGAFIGDVKGERILEEGTLLLSSTDKKYSTELSTALQPVAKYEGSRAVFSGALYDFSLQDATNYSLTASAGTSGVDLRAAVDVMQENGCLPSLNFSLVGSAANGEIEAVQSNDTPIRIPSSENKKLSGIKEILFNAGKSPQLYVSFEKPVEIELQQEGLKRRVSISFKGELKISFAPENVQQKQKMLSAITGLNDALKNNTFGDAETKLKALRTNYASRFPEARTAADRATETLDTKWKETTDEIEKTLKPLETTVSAVALDFARATVNKYIGTWNGSDKSFTSYLTRITVFEKSGQNEAIEQDAIKFLALAEKFFASKTYTVALPYLTKILNDPAMAKTKAGEKARELLPKYQAANDKDKVLRQITEDILESIQILEASKDYKKAIDKIEKNEKYQQNKSDLPDLEKKLSDLRKKMTP